MKRTKAIAIMGIFVLISSCTHEYSFDEVVGSYESRDYPSLSKAVMTLNADSTYKQLFLYRNEDILTNEGRWEFFHSPRLGTQITLRDAIVMWCNWKQDTVYADTFDVWVFDIDAYPLSNRMFIEIDPDNGIHYYKLKTN